MAEPELRPRASSSSEDESEPFVDASAARDTPDPVASTANDAPDPARPSPPSPPLPLPSHPPVYSITSTCTKCATRFQFEPPGPAASHSVSCYACGHGNIVSESPSGKSAAKNTGSKKRKQGSDAEPLETEYYDLLKVVPTATAGEIKKGYYFMAQKYHPDKNPDDPHAEELFKSVSKAYQILSDPQLRATYNKFGAAAFQPGAAEDPEAAAAAAFGDPVEFFRSQFGGEGFIDIIGDIAIAKDFGDAITSSNSGAEPTPEDPEKKKRREEEHEARVARLAGKLSERLDVYSDGFAFTDSEEPDKEAEREALRKFREKFKAEANELRKENFGVELLHALGFTYRLKAGQNLAKIDAESGHLGKKIWGMGARFWGGIREKKQVISETFSTVKTAYELQSSFTKLQELEDRRKARENGDELPPPKKGPALSAEEEAELSRKLEQEAATKGMEALWMGSKLEVQSVIREVCDVVLAEEVERERRRRRCIALDALGEVYESVRPE